MSHSGTKFHENPFRVLELLLLCDKNLSTAEYTRISLYLKSHCSFYHYPVSMLMTELRLCVTLHNVSFNRHETMNDSLIANRWQAVRHHRLRYRAWFLRDVKELGNFYFRSYISMK